MTGRFQNIIFPLLTISLFLSLHPSPGQPHSVTGFSIQSLLPSNIRHYMTYEGSLTQPPCHENVEWIILNRPLYTSIQDLRIIRNSITGADNFRPIQRTNIRTIRTNIDFVSTSSKEQDSNRSNVERIAGNVENKKKGDNSSKTCSITRFSSYKSVVRQYKEPSTSHWTTLMSDEENFEKKMEKTEKRFWWFKVYGWENSWARRCWTDKCWNWKWKKCRFKTWGTGVWESWGKFSHKNNLIKRCTSETDKVCMSQCSLSSFPSWNRDRCSSQSHCSNSALFDRRSCLLSSSCRTVFHTHFSFDTLSPESLGIK